LFLQHNVVCYVLTLPAVSEGKQYVLFSAEDESGTMVVGHREIIMQPALGPLEIIESNFAEGRFVGLLPRQATSGMQQSQSLGAAICTLMSTRPNYSRRELLAKAAKNRATWLLQWKIRKFRDAARLWL